jgi:hypothetical protein
MEGSIMTSNLKALGLSLLAVFAVGAVFASAATAKFEDEKNVKTVVTGEGELVFSTKAAPAFAVTCQKSTFSGTEKLPALTLTLHPTFANCTGSGVTKVDTTGCGLIFYSETKKHMSTDGKEEEFDSDVEVDCPNVKGIIITSSICNVTIPGPGGERFLGAYYHNEGAGAQSDVTMTVTMDEVKYTTNGVGCALAGLPKNGADGTLTTKKSVTLKGYEDLCKEEGGKDMECPFVPTGGTDNDTYTDGNEIGIVWKEG